MKEPKVIDEPAEARMQNFARASIERLEEIFPLAREIDLLNAYLRVFTKRAEENTDEA